MRSRLIRSVAAQIAVIAHRGEHIRHAENSIASIQSAAELGADFVELDVRATRDGKLVLMHDKTVDRTTDGHGSVHSLTLEQIRGLHFRTYGDAVTTFDEALEIAHGRISVYLDWKDASPKTIFQVLSAHGMLKSVVVYGDRHELQQLEKLAPGSASCPRLIPKNLFKKPNRRSSRRWWHLIKTISNRH